jgi:predicted dehydrogenase
MARIYRVAVVGCGHRGREHAAGIQAESRCQIVALSDVNEQAAESLNRDLGLNAKVYRDHHDMLKQEALDIVVTSLWTPLHLPVFRDSAQAGVKAVISEKPMAPTWGECLEIANIAQETNCQLTFCHQRRFAKGNQLARKLISEGVFGEIQRMELYSPPNLLDCGTHTIDQALSFVDETPVKWVLGAVDASEPLNWFGVSAEGMAAGTLVFENGIRAHIQVGGPDMDIWGGVRVHGSKGFFAVDWDGKCLEARVYDDPAWQLPVLAEGADNHMVGVVGDAVDALEAGIEPELSYKKALRASEVIFAFYESVRRHARVALPLQGVTDNPFVTMLENHRF